MQNGAEPEMSLIPEKVRPWSWLTASTIGTVTREAARFPMTYWIQVTITFPWPHAVRTGWSGKTDRPKNEPLPAATSTGVDQCLPPSPDLETTTSGVLFPPSARVAR